MKIRKQLAIGLMAAMALFNVVQAHANALGMVLDIKGSAKAELAGRIQTLDITSPLSAGARIRVEKGGELSFVFYPARSQISVVGPASLQVLEKNIKQLQGEPMTSRPLPENRSAVALKFQNRVVPAAALMRAVESMPLHLALVEPAQGETALAEQPEFVWIAPAGKEMEFTLTAGSSVLHQQTVTGSRLVLPTTVVLRSGQQYQWEIAPLDDKVGQPVSGTFTLATPEQRALLKSLQPTTQAPLGEWVLYGLALNEANMLSEGNRVWKHLTGLRPTSSKLKSLQN